MTLIMNMHATHIHLHMYLQVYYTIYIYRKIINNEIIISMNIKIKLLSYTSYFEYNVHF